MVHHLMSMHMTHPQYIILRVARPLENMTANSKWFSCPLPLYETDTLYNLHTLQPGQRGIYNSIRTLCQIHCSNFQLLHPHKGTLLPSTLRNVKPMTKISQGPSWPTPLERSGAMTHAQFLPIWNRGFCIGDLKVGAPGAVSQLPSATSGSNPTQTNPNHQTIRFT